MAKGDESKQKILRCAGQLFVKNGYHSTGIQKILQESHLPKGSFYYHFQDKEDIAIQVCQYYERMIQEIFIQASEEESWERFVDRFVDQIKQKMQDGILYGCPSAVIGMETAQTEPKIAHICQKSLDELIRGYSRILMKYGWAKEDANRYAIVLMELYEGSLLYYRISQDLSVVEGLKEQFIEIVRRNKDEGSHSAF